MMSGALDALKQWHLKMRGEVVGDALLLVNEKGSEPAPQRSHTGLGDSTTGMDSAENFMYKH
jgi:hypothetical protein